MNKSEAEALIYAVSKRPLIWDKKNKTMSTSRMALDRCWKDISEELDMNEGLLRRKWKYLRDQFTVEWAKSAEEKSCDALDPNLTSKWHFFDQLVFLKGIVKPRFRQQSAKPAFLSFSNDNPSVSQDCSVSVELLEGDCENVSVESSDSSNAFVPQPGFQHNPSENGMGVRGAGRERGGRDMAGQNRKRQYGGGSLELSAEKHRRRRKAITEDYQLRNLVRMEQKKIDYLLDRFNDTKAAKETGENDNDLLFLKSLLPYIKRIPEENKLRFRSRLQELVQEFTFPAHAQNVSPPVCTVAAVEAVALKSSPPMLSDNEALE